MNEHTESPNREDAARKTQKTVITYIILLAATAGVMLQSWPDIGYGLAVALWGIIRALILKRKTKKDTRNMTRHERIEVFLCICIPALVTLIAIYMALTWGISAD